MGTMRNGMQTWLKQECVSIAESLNELEYRAVNIAGHAHNYTEQQVGNDVDKLATDFKLLMEKVNDSNRDVVLEYMGNAEYGVDTVANMAKAAALLRKMSFEQVVECQCGKGTSNLMIGKRVKEHHTGRTGTIARGKPNGWGVSFDDEQSGGATYISYTYTDSDLDAI